MITIYVNGSPLKLFAGLEIQADLLNRSLHGLSDPYTIPFEAPVEGNEIVLQHARSMRSGRRSYRYENASVHIGTTHFANGKLFILADDDKVYRLSLSIQGFVATIKDLKLRELDLGEIYLGNTSASLIDYAADQNAGTYPEKIMAFPVVYNPDLYQGNDDWFPSADRYESSKAYSVNDLVEFDEGSIVIRTNRFQCIAAASPFESPATAPAKWRRTAYGIVNHWDHAAGAFLENTSLTGNVYAMAPYFYLKYILKQVAGLYGYRLDGDWWESDATDRIILHSSTALDDEGRANYLLATQTAPIVHSGTPIARIEPDDESTAPNQDADNVWNNTTFRYAPPVPGTYIFRLNVVVSFSIPCELGFALRRVSTNTVLTSTVRYSGGSPKYDHDHTFSIYHNFFVGDPADEFEVIIFDATSELGSIAAASQNITITSSWLQSWQQGQSLYNAYADRIIVNQHLPDLTIEEFLQSLDDGFCCKVDPDAAKGVLSVEFKKNSTFSGRPRQMGTRLNGPIERDHQQGSKKMVLHWDLPDDERGEILDKSSLYFAGTFDKPQDIPASEGLFQYCHVRSDRGIYITKPVGLNIYWYRAGVYLDDHIEGEGVNEEEITPAWTPPFMDVVYINDEELLVPHIIETGTSAYYGHQNAPSFRLMYYQGVVANDNGATYPFATPFDRRHDGAQHADKPLDWNGTDGLVDLYYSDWLKAKAHGIPCTASLRLNAEDLLRPIDGIWVLDNRRFIPDTIPLTIQGDELRTDDCKLLMLPEG